MSEPAALPTPGRVPVPRGRAGPARSDDRRFVDSSQPLADLLDRLVDRGAVISGDIVISLAGVELLRVDLRLLVIGVQTAMEGAAAPPHTRRRDR